MSSVVRVARVPNPSYKRSGLKSYVHLIIKYKFNPTKPGPYFVTTRKTHSHHQHKQEKVLQKKDLATGQAGNVTADDQQNDSEYLCPVSIGTPAKTLSLDFDTGSSDLWVWSSELPSSDSTSGHTVYNPSQSSTSKQVSGATWQISYGDGSSASGDVYSDTIIIGGIAVPGQEIEAAKQLSSQFSSGTGDGLLGLAWPSINTVQPTPAATPVENMINQKLIPQGLFTAYLSSYRQDSSSSEGESFYTFGGLDQSVLTAANATEPYYTTVDNSQGFWQFESATASVNGQSIARSGNTAIADTGTTLALVDDNTVEAIYKAIPGSSYDNQQQGYVFPTTVTPEQLPVVKFAVGGQEFAVPKESLAFVDTGSGTYYGGIQSRGDMTFDILGDTFLKGIYAVFDQANTRFGAVQRADPTGNTLSDTAPTSTS